METLPHDGRSTEDGFTLGVQLVVVRRQMHGALSFRSRIAAGFHR